MPEISVLMSVYNPPSRCILLNAVGSVISQSFKDWEMVIYDDGSGKEGEEIIKEAAALDPRIFLVRGEKNMGLAHGLNESLAFAKGEFIARMDGDDISRPDRFLRQLEFLKENPAYGWVGCCAELIDSRGRWGVWRVPKEPGKEDFLKYSPFIHPSVMFRRKVLAENGGYRDVSRLEDYELFMRMTAEGFKGYNLQEVLFCYREDRDSYKRRRYVYRIEEARLRYKGFKAMGILVPSNYIYVIKPLLVGLVPAKLAYYFKTRRRYGTYLGRKRKRTAGQI